MTLAIHAIVVRPEPLASHASLLGTVFASTYHHLYDEAGVFSRPSTVRRGVTRIYSPPYQAPTAEKELRSADLASAAVAEVLETLPLPASKVGAIMHAQCTLDRQILGSTCLRVQYDHFPNAHSAITIGQLGTAALPTVLNLMQMRLRSTGALGCVSASDQWIAPFYRRIPELVTYGDVGAACVLSASADVASVAHVEAIATGYRRMPGEPWSADAGDVADELTRVAVECVERVLSGHSARLDRDSLVMAGDRYCGAVAERVAAAAGIAEQVLPVVADAHLSSAALLGSINAAVERVVRGGEDRYAVVWTASLSGHAGAALIRIHAHAEPTAHGWRTPVASYTKGASEP